MTSCDKCKKEIRHRHVKVTFDLILLSKDILDKGLPPVKGELCWACTKKAVRELFDFDLSYLDGEVQTWD